MGMEVFQRRKLFDRLDLPRGVARKYFQELEANYGTNPFTNSIHAADVMQATHVLLWEVEKYMDVPPDMVLVVLLAAAAHDYKHPGFTRGFLVATNHALTETYTGATLLEDMSSNEAFGLLKKASLDMLGEWADFKAATVRELAGRLVVSTAGVDHFAFAASMGRTLAEDADLTHGRTLERLLELVLRAADVSFAGRPFAISKQWVDRLAAESFRQGDRERDANLSVSPFMDRYRPQVALSQLLFSTFIAAPLLHLVGSVAPTARDMFDSHLAANTTYVACAVSYH